MSLATGTRIGAYEIRGSLGVGGMGEVYRAHDPRLGRDVAIKILQTAVATDPDRLARFDREARTLAALNHPHIAQIHGVEETSVGTEAGSSVSRAIVMELVEGDDLAERIARGKIPLDEALAIARQIADALQAAHDAGIIHRDLKPANVKVRPDGTVKVLDFGLAKGSGSQGPEDSAGSGGHLTITSPAVTMHGVILGTAAYMAPEQAKGKPVDKRADIWAFGCVLYEMLSGQRPFQGEDITDTIAAVVSKEPDWTPVPAPAIRLLQHCLQKDPRRRLRDIGDAWSLLDDSPRTSGPAAAPGRTNWLLASLTALAVLAAAWLAYVHFGEQPAAPVLTRLHVALPPGATPDLNFQVSPDGRRLAFLGRGADGITRVFLRDFDEVDARPLAGTDNVGSGSLFWSPDSRWLAFQNENRLKKIDAAGGSIQTIADVTGAGVIGGAWNANGIIVIGSNPDGRAGGGGLFKVAAAGGQIAPLTALDPARQDLGHRFPVFLPDNRRFLYMRASYDPEQSGIFLGDTDLAPQAQSSTRILATPAAPAVFLPPVNGQTSAGQLLFFRSNALMVQPFDVQSLQFSGEPRTVAEPVGTFLDRGLFSVGGSKTLVYTSAAGGLNMQLRWFDGEGTPGTLVGVPGAYNDLSLAPDETRAIVAVSEFDRGARRTLWAMDFARGTRTRLTFGPGRHRTPVWSPDSASIVYVTEVSEGTTLLRKPASGADADEVLFKTSESMAPTSISRDGRFLLFTVTKAGTQQDVWVLPLQGDRTPYALIATAASERDAQISPDGRWVAHVAREPSGTFEVYVRPFSASPATPADTKWQISTDGGDFPRWLANGRQLSYVVGDATSDARRMMVVDVTPGPSFQWGAPRQLMTIPRGTTMSALTADGKRLLAAIPAEANATPRPLMVVLNWMQGRQ